MSKPTKVYGDIRFVGNWKVESTLKEVAYNHLNLKFPSTYKKIISISNTSQGTLMSVGKDGSGVLATRASGIGVMFEYTTKSDSYILKVQSTLNIIDDSRLIGESVEDWSLHGKGSVAKVVVSSTYTRIGKAPFAKIGH